MRALRSFLPFAARRARPGGEAPAERGRALGRVGRRRFLGFLVASPVLAPAAIKAAGASRMLRGEFVTLGVDVQHLGALASAPISVADFRESELRCFAAGLGEASLTLPELEATASFSPVVAQTLVDYDGATAAALALDAIPLDVGVDATLRRRACAPFVDDVGSGP